MLFSGQEHDEILPDPFLRGQDHHLFPEAVKYFGFSVLFNDPEGIFRQIKFLHCVGFLFKNIYSLNRCNADATRTQLSNARDHALLTDSADVNKILKLFVNHKNISTFAPQFINPGYPGSIRNSGNLNYLKQFKIPFKGLSLGTHVYDWELDKKFFEAVESPDVIDCRLKVALELEKQERMMILVFHISGRLEVACDRCLDPLDLPVDVVETYYIKFGDEFREESETILVIPDSEYQVSVSDLIYDYISLSVPIKKVHPDDSEGNSTCNNEALSRLEQLSVQKGNDPRWEALKNIKLDKNT